MNEHENLCNSIKEMRMPNISKINGAPEWLQVFTNDGVHLTEAAGKVFVESIILEAEIFFKQ
jgi:hypothetical protein